MKLAERLALTENMKFRRTCPLVRLSVTLRWLAGGSYLDIAFAHSLPTSTVYYIINDTVERIYTCLTIKFPYNDENWLRKVAKNFPSGSSSPLSMCADALDGIFARIVEPSASEVSNSSTSCTRKGFFAICVQEMCESFYRVTFLSCLCPGSKHESTAFSISSLFRLLAKEEGGLLPGFLIAADEAYP